VGERPELGTLGPFHWQPSPAADFTLTDYRGEPISLGQFRGKPVIVIFYLGFGCLHCVEQLNTFGPMYQQFADAGISLVAIGTDDVAAIERAVAARQQSGTAPLAIPLIPNADASVFKAYRAFDDFEQMPLHGMFLIDGEGLVRWQDIGYEPFSDAKFLLEEAKRLLPLRVEAAPAPVAAAPATAAPAR
jgi:peroxiredoxin